MRLLEPAAARLLFRQLLQLFSLLAIFGLATALLIRSFWHYDVAVASLDDTARGGVLLQQLEQLDAQYRVRKDGSVLVASSDTERLQQAGVPMTDARSEPPRFYQLLMMLLLAGVGMAIVFVGRKLVAAIRELLGRNEPCETAVMVEPFKAETEENSSSFQDASTKAPSGKCKLFEGEHPQTVAVYLLGISVAEAAEALEAMPGTVRDAVWERMAFSGACEKSLQEYVQTLYAQKVQAIRKRTRPPEVTDKMAAIFRRLPSLTQDALIGALRRGDADSAFVALLEAETNKQMRPEEA